MWRFGAAFALSVGLALVLAGQTRATTPVIGSFPIDETFGRTVYTAGSALSMVDLVDGTETDAGINIRPW
jgi:hypothetical protein